MPFTAEQQASYRAVLAPNATDNQWNYFITECERRQLVPGVHVVFQLKNVGEWNRQLGAYVNTDKVTLITTIVALRLIAQRTGAFAGYGETRYHYYQPETLNTLIPQGRIPHAVSMEVYRTGWLKPVMAVARYEAYVQLKNVGDKKVPTFMWQQRGEEQLAKCAEALALRMLAPEELGGLYLAEEFQHADTEQETPAAVTDERTGKTITVGPAIPEPTIAPPVNNAPATREPFQTLVPNVTPDPAHETRMFSMPEIPAVFSVPTAPIATPKPAQVHTPPKPPAPPKPRQEPATPVVITHAKPPAPPAQEPVEETLAELNAVADAIARDKDPAVPLNLAGVDITDADLPENLQPATVTETAPVQANTAVLVQVDSADTPATQAEYANFVNNRAAKLVRDKLAKVKNASVLMKEYLLRHSGKATLPKISAATFEALISPLENTPDVDAIVSILKA